MKKKWIFIVVGAMLVLAVAAGLAFASDASPKEEPAGSPFFEDTLQQAVDELDGKVERTGVRSPAQNGTQHYTTDVNVWPECEFGYTRDLDQWPWCHYTSDPQDLNCETPWPTADYTWDSSFWWVDCSLTQDLEAPWCMDDPPWTIDPAMGWQCDPMYTKDPALWHWCEPMFTKDPARWPDICLPGIPWTYDPGLWPEWCIPEEITTDPYRWPECHYTSNAQLFPECIPPYPTKDYTSSPDLWPECPGPGYTEDIDHWPWCDPGYTSNPFMPPCETGIMYTEAPAIWPWCGDPLYTADPVWWPWCHFTSDPELWPGICDEPYPTMDYTWDMEVWPECREHTSDPAAWPWCDPMNYTTDPAIWPWCNPAWTWAPADWPACQPGYTNDPDVWEECRQAVQYTYDPVTWPECESYTADARIWPDCHFTSDPRRWPECLEWDEPTKDYTTDPGLWEECADDPFYTSDPILWPECHFTSDPVMWPDTCQELDLGDLGDAPDSSNHAGTPMLAYPPGGPPAKYPTVFDQATGAPPGPKHFAPRLQVWLGPWATEENDADLMPDEDGVTNIDPPGDVPNRDGADDGLMYPLQLNHCLPSVISYTVTVSPTGPGAVYFANAWFDWNRDGDWDDTFVCPDGSLAYEWAVQDQVIALPAGTHVVPSLAFLAFNPAPDPMWMRLSIAEGMAPRNPTNSLADGRGPDLGYELGETEDYFLRLEQEEYDIWIKDSSTDDGSVPTVGPYWLSPDIWVRNDGDCTNTSHQDPIPGTTTTVCIRVRNRMATAVDNITVNAYWANAALALSWPTSWSYVNTFNIPNLPGFGSVVRWVPWNVPFITGHFCLLAQADAPKDPLGSGPDTVPPVYLTENNNNIGQKNTNIVDTGPEIQHCGFFSTTVATDTVYFDAVNTWNKPVTVDIEFESADFSTCFGQMILEPGTLWMRWTSLTSFNVVNADQTLHLSPGFPAAMTGIQMAPFETARMTMTIGARIDQKFTIDVTEIVSGITAGGITYIRDLPACLYLPIVLKDF